jgi:hypothetical protein
MDAAQRQPAAAVTGPLLATGRAQQTSGLLIPTVFSLVADQLTPNELALLLRPLCKEARDLLPDATTVQLSQPVPEAAFATKWGQPGSMKHLNYWHRHEAMCLTAKSGVVANLRLLAVGPGGSHEVGAAGCGLAAKVFETAAGAGQLQMCQLLRELGCPWGDWVIDAAARGGHTGVLLWLREAGCPVLRVLNAAAKSGDVRLCQWLVINGFPWHAYAAGDAAWNGHAELMRWFLELGQQDPQRKPVNGRKLLEGAAYGLDLATMQARILAEGRPHVCTAWCGTGDSADTRLLPFTLLAHELYALYSPQADATSRGHPLFQTMFFRRALLAEAALSPTPDYRAKVRGDVGCMQHRPALHAAFMPACYRSHCGVVAG